MNPQTFFTIIGAVAGVATVMLAIAMPIFALVSKNIALELEKRLTEKFDAKLNDHKQEILRDIIRALRDNGRT